MGEETIQLLITKFLSGDNLTAQEEELLLKWLKESKENEQLFLQYSRIWNSSINIDETFDVFTRRITEEAEHRSDTTKKNYFLYAISTAAAIALIFIVSQIVIKSPQSEISDLIVLAQQKVVDLSEVKDVQLVLSDNQTIAVEQDESTISYNANEKISVNNDTEISKKDIAKYNELITPYGKRSKLLLPDGSEIYVNSGTRVIYPSEFSENKREIYVEGEVFLNIKKNEKRPFIVNTDKSIIQVLGTSFNVFAYKDISNHEVVLVSGSVQIKDLRENSKVHKLKPNDKFTLNNDISSIEIVDTKKYTSWVLGQYIYEHERMDNILRTLKRYYGEEIVYDKQIAHLTFSGKLDIKDNLNQVLEAMESTAPIIHLVDADGLHIIKKR